jgi:N-acetyl-beta-hexosaminidase
MNQFTNEPIDMKKIIISFLLLVGAIIQIKAQETFATRGFCIAAPSARQLNTFIKFIDEELAPRKVNTLVLRIDFNYQFKTHPELTDGGALSNENVKKIVAVCKRNQIRIIPQINLLGHQSWANSLGKLLKVYPEFDETPQVKMPEKYEWPNADGLYCKSYCPLHPGVHKVVFDLVDEICDAFEADAFHAGMDEVFYIGDDKCPRCSGLNKAELYANEVNKISNHLALSKRQLWIWGDRLLDGKTTGIGAWEASMNNTHQAIDLINKNVMICDWHYERPDQTAVYFAMKGLSVITCPWKNVNNAIAQTRDMINSRKSATAALKPRYAGMMQTIWSGADSFLAEFYGQKSSGENSEANCFKALFNEINQTK